MTRPKKVVNLMDVVDKLVRSLNAPIDTQGEFGKMADVPNKRKPGKKFIGGYVSNEVKKKFKLVADKETDGDARKMLLKFVVEGLKKRGIHAKDEAD